MALKRRRCDIISDMSQSFAHPTTRRTPTTRVENNVQTPPPTIGLTDITPITSPLINESNVADSRCSGAQCSELMRSLSQPSSTRPSSSQPSSTQPSSSQPSSSQTCLELPLCWVEGGHFMPSDKVHVNEISRIIKAGFTGVWTTYSSVPDKIKDHWFAEFKTHFKVEPQCEMLVRKLFNTKAGSCFTNSMHYVRKKWFEEGRRVDWIDEGVMTKLLEKWESQEFRDQSDTNKSNRHRVTSDGRLVAKSNGGSRSTFDSQLHLRKIFGREPTSIEVYLFNHTSRTTKAPVDAIAENIQDSLVQKLPDVVPLMFQKGVSIPDEIRHQADKVLVDTLIDSAGGMKNGRISGLGNISQQHIRSTRPQSTPDLQVSELTKQVAELTNQNRLLNEKLQEMAARDTARDTEMASFRQFMTSFGNRGREEHHDT